MSVLDPEGRLDLVLEVQGQLRGAEVLQQRDLTVVGTQRAQMVRRRTVPAADALLAVELAHVRTLEPSDPEPWQRVMTDGDESLADGHRGPIEQARERGVRE